MNSVTIKIRNKQMRIHTQSNWEGKIDPSECKVDSEEAYNALTKMFPSVDFSGHKEKIINGFEPKKKQTYHAGQIFESPYGALILAQVGHGLVQLICLEDGNRLHDIQIEVRDISNITGSEYEAMIEKEIGISPAFKSIQDWSQKLIPDEPIFTTSTASTNELVVELEKRGQIVINASTEDLLETLKNRTGHAYRPEPEAKGLSRK